MVLIISHGIGYHRNGSNYGVGVPADMQPEGYSMDTLEQYQCGTLAENQIYNAETNTLYIGYYYVIHEVTESQMDAVLEYLLFRGLILYAIG